jgi:hypothetical protein
MMSAFLTKSSSEIHYDTSNIYSLQTTAEYVHFDDLWYRKQNELKALAVDDGKGRGAILPSRETVENAQYRPFSHPLFIYVNITAAQRKPELQAFVQYYINNAKNLVTQVGYNPLPDEGYRLTNLHFYQGKVGTVFEGVPQPDLMRSLNCYGSKPCSGVWLPQANIGESF